MEARSPFPDPKKIVEGAVIKHLSDERYLVIACGGGGIPVIKDEDGTYRGVEAVIDKDLAGERLAQEVGADIFMTHRCSQSCHKLQEAR